MNGLCARLTRRVALMMVLTLFALTIKPVAAADIDWEGWSFDWSVNNQLSGLVLTDVAYQGEKILGKASLPVMRVEYTNHVCGPYADVLSTDVLKPADNGAPESVCDGQSVCTREFTQGSEKFLEVGSNWQIGEYQIYQTFYFSEQGYFDARIYSRGLQCLVDHRHHPHWMFDFDVSGKENDVIFSDDIEHDVEFNDLKANSSQWTVKDKVSGTEVLIIPSTDDGEPSEFSQWDLAARAYDPSETGRWQAGAYGEIGQLFNESEPINGEDLVVWYVAHLAHSTAEGSEIWHASGPRIQVLSAQSTSVESAAAVPVPDSIAPPSGSNLLINGDFEDDQTGWLECGEAQDTVTSKEAVSSGLKAMRIENGGCLYQDLTVAVGQQLTLSCDAKHPGNEWAIMEISFSDQDYSVLSTNTTQLESVVDFTAHSKTAIAPANSEFAVVLLYSEDEAYFDNCVLESGQPALEPENENEGASNLLTNGDFEEGISAWQSCAANRLSGVAPDAISGQQSLAVTDGGCVYQEFAIQASQSYDLICQVKKQGAAQTSLRLSTFTAGYESVGFEEAVVEEGDFQEYSVSVHSLQTAAKGVAVLYSEDPANFDRCVVTEY